MIAVLYNQIRGEHKNTPWFQIVIKLKLTGVFLQLGGYSYINSYSFIHTQCAPLLLLGKHRCDNLARTRISVAYPAWPNWQLFRDRRSAWMSLSLITDAFSFNEIPVPLQNGLVSKRIHIKFALESTLHNHNTVCLWNSNTHQLRCCELSAILHFTALWRRAGKWKISWVNVSAVQYL
jgi:hypothetical protein